MIDLARERARAKTVPASDTLLAVGGVNYLAGDFGRPRRPPRARREHHAGRDRLDAAGAAIQGDRPPSWGPLPATLAEAKAIRDLFGKVTHGRAELLNDKDATKDHLAAAMPGHRYLHLATHGYFAGAEVKSALVPHDDETVRSAIRDPGPVGGRGPLPRPALRLGVGRRECAPEEPGHRSARHRRRRHDRRGGRRARPQGLRTDGPLRLPDRA